jgi:hypothetical protein
VLRTSAIHYKADPGKSIAWPLLRHELCHTSYVQNNIYVCTKKLDDVIDLFGYVD